MGKGDASQKRGPFPEGRKASLARSEHAALLPILRRARDGRVDSRRPLAHMPYTHAAAGLVASRFPRNAPPHTFVAHLKTTPFSLPLDPRIGHAAIRSSSNSVSPGQEKGIARYIRARRGERARRKGRNEARDVVTEELSLSRWPRDVEAISDTWRDVSRQVGKAAGTTALRDKRWTCRRRAYTEVNAC